MTAISSPNCRWHVGEVEITRVLEFEAALFEPAVIHPDASRNHCAAPTWLEPRLMDPPSGLLVFAFHSMVTKTPRATILVDTCSAMISSARTSCAISEELALSRQSRRRRFYVRGHRLCAVHASARRSRRLEHATSRRPMGPDPSRMPATCSPAGSGRPATAHRHEQRQVMADLVFVVAVLGAPSTFWHRLELAHQDGQSGGMTPLARLRYTGYPFPAEIISHTMWLYFRFSLGLGTLEQLLAARGTIAATEPCGSGRASSASSSPSDPSLLARVGDKWHLDELVPRSPG
jgi:hypothetical protein